LYSIGRVIKNIIFLFSSEIFGNLLAVIYFILSARYLGPNMYGIISFSISFYTIMRLFVDLGQHSLTIREVSRRKEEATKYQANLLPLRFLLVVLTLVIVFSIFNFIGFPKIKLVTIYIVSAYFLFNSLTSVIFSIFVAFEKIIFQSILVVFRNLIILLFAIMGVLFEYNVWFFALGYGLAGFFTMIFALFIYRLTIGKLIFEFDLKFCKKIFKDGFSFIFPLIYQSNYYLDAVILSFLKSNESVGIYSVALNTALIFQFFPLIMSTAFFPLLSREFSVSSKKFNYYFSFYLKIALLIGLPSIIGFFLVSKNIIFVFFGIDYINSLIPLRILIISFFFIFIRNLFQLVLLSSNLEKELAKIISLVMIIYMFISFPLTMFFDFFGMSLSRLFVELIFCILCFIVFNFKLRPYIKFEKKFLKDYSYIFLSSILMAIFVFIFIKLNNLPDKAELFISIAIGFFTYIFFIVINKAINLKEIFLIFKNNNP